MRRIATAIVSLWILAGCEFGKNERQDHGAAARKSADGTDQEPRADEANLAPYLLNHGDAGKLLDPLFLKYEPITSVEKVKLTPYPALKPIQSYLQDFLSQALKLDAFQPGRSVLVVVTKNEDVNAAMDGWGQMEVNSGIIGPGQVVPLLATLCHEVGHSARNHHFARLQDHTCDGAYSGPTIDAINGYWEAQYNKLTKTYKHKASTFDKLAADYTRVSADCSVYMRRSESEADIVGARVCAQIGMSPSDFASGLSVILTDETDQKHDSGYVYSAKELKDGEEFDVDDEDNFLWYFLFVLDDHPTRDERLAQLDRLKDLEGVETPNSDFFDGWQKNYPSERSRATSGISLTSAPPLKVVAVDNNNHRQVVIRKPLH